MPVKVQPVHQNRALRFGGFLLIHYATIKSDFGLSIDGKPYNPVYMFKNYFKTACRNLLHNRIYSFINIAGLSIGLACAMLIMLYIKDEVSYDRFHKNVNRIYRIDKQQKKDDGSI